MTSLASRARRTPGGVVNSGGNVGQGLRMAVPTDGSRTVVLHDAQPREEAAVGSGSEVELEGNDDEHVVGVLRLRGARRTSQRVAWTEDVVDNEGMGKKKSKICCIYHKPRAFDESSSESSDSDDTDSDSSCGGNGHGHAHGHSHRRPPPWRQNRQRNGEGHGESPANGHNQAMREGGSSGGNIQELSEDENTNAYERLPKKKGKGRGGPSLPTTVTPNSIAPSILK